MDLKLFDILYTIVVLLVIYLMRKNRLKNSYNPNSVQTEQDERVRAIAKQVIQNRDIKKDSTIKVTVSIPEKPKQTAKKVWSWPIIEVPGGSASSNDFGNGYWEEISPLKMFGYTVGKTNGWSATKRKRFLNDFMSCDLPSAVEKIYGIKYGDPSSPERLKAVANLISSLIIAAKRRNGSSMEYAIQDWTEDLNYLKTKFYVAQGLKLYPWPSIQPK